MRVLSVSIMALVGMTGCGAAQSLGVPGVSDDDDDAEVAPETASSDPEPDDEPEPVEENPLEGQPELTAEQEEIQKELADVLGLVGAALDHNAEEDMRGAGWSIRESVVAAPQTCIELSDRLLEEGIGGDFYVQLPFNSGIDSDNIVSYRGDRYIPLSELSGQCEDARENLREVSLAGLEPVVEALDLMTREYDEESGTHPGDDVPYGNRIEECYDVVANLSEDFEMPEDTPIDVPGLVEMELGELETQLCYRLEVVGKEFREAESEREAAARLAELEPYKKALSGGKWDLFWDRGMENKGIRGRGGNRLDRPRDFAQASLWCETLSNPNVVPEEWTVRCFQFRGNKLVDRRERTGQGSRPPSNAYR